MNSNSDELKMGWLRQNSMIVCCMLIMLNIIGVFTSKSSTPETPQITSTSHKPSTAHSKPNSSSDTLSNGSLVDVGLHKTWMSNFGVNDENIDMYQRAFYVVMGVTALVIIYLVVKMIIMKSRKRKARKYGVLDVSTQRLTQSDEEDDLFDQSQRRLIS